MQTIRLAIESSDVDTVAEWLNQDAAGQCTSAQHAAIARQILARVVTSAWLERRDCRTPAIVAVVQRKYSNHARATRARGKLAPARRTV